MSRRFHPQSASTENVEIIMRSLPWKTIITIIIAIMVFLPFFACGLFFTNKGLLDISHIFTTLSGAQNKLPPPHTTFPYPTVQPQIGTIPYIIQDGDSCNGILGTQMHMGASTKIFNDNQKNTIQALNQAIGQRCDELTIGARIQLQPQYPLVAVGGIVRKIGVPSFIAPTPTPAIHLPRTIQQQAEDERYIDCTGGCSVTVQITEQNTATLFVKTQLHVLVGSWVWALAMMQPKSVKGFATYPYTDPKVSLNNMMLKVCDFTVEDKLDDTVTPCRKITPNSIDDDGGAWVYGITGPHALGHWQLGNNLPSNTPTLMWLTSKGGDLQYEDDNPLYRYDARQKVYVKAKQEKV